MTGNNLGAVLTGSRMLFALAENGELPRFFAKIHPRYRTPYKSNMLFFVFTGLFVGLATGVLYLLVRRWLPVGRAAGLAYGALLLVVAGTRLDPLRPGNPDFDLVGPGWVSVAAFATLVVFHGVLVAALAARVSRAVPLLSARPRAIVAHAPLLLLLPLGSAVLLLAVVGVMVVLASQVPAVVAAWRDRRLVTVGRVALAAVAVVASPGFASAVVDILGRP